MEWKFQRKYYCNGLEWSCDGPATCPWCFPASRPIGSNNSWACTESHGDTVHSDRSVKFRVKQNTKTEKWIKPPPQCSCLQPAASSAGGNMSVWIPPELQDTEQGWPHSSMDFRVRRPLSDLGTAARGSGSSLGCRAGCLFADWSSRPQSEKRQASELRQATLSCQGHQPALGAGRWVLEPGWRAAWSALVWAAPQNQMDWWNHRSIPHWLHSAALQKTA